MILGRGFGRDALSAHTLILDSGAESCINNPVLFYEYYANSCNNFDILDMYHYTVLIFPVSVFILPDKCLSFDLWDILKNNWRLPVVIVTWGGLESLSAEMKWSKQPKWGYLLV